MSPSPGFEPSKRQLWNPPTTAATSTPSPWCTPFPLPANGVLSLADSVITLTTSVVFQPACTGAPDEHLDGYSSVIADWKDPFYASTTPQTYVIAAATVIAWILVFMLIITPRTSFFGNPVSRPGLGGKHGIIGGANGGGSSLGVGSRPWLQKVAAFTVAVSLTIATADTFKSLEKQYALGYMDASAMREDVMGSLEIRITRVISDIFLWLAQVQTLIRLFPRHKEKVLIKWIGFGLIICDTTFSCLNSFYANITVGPTKPRHFVDAIPALSYLFELALGLLYAAWVIYYSMTKRRYAFYHAKMRSITLIALLSFVAVLTPVVFFVTDVSNSDVAGWGDYFRWVGAAAASVIVWEWVERIEAIESDDKKDGILGREIYDGDEMLDVTPSNEVLWSTGRRGLSRMRKGGGRGDDDDDHGRGDATNAMERGLHGFTARFRKPPPPAPKHYPLGRARSHHTEAPTDGSRTGTAGSGTIAFGRLPKRRGQRNRDNGITPPPAIASPISRTDTTSAASTVYVVRYDDGGGDIPQPIRRRVDADGNVIEGQDHRDSTLKDPEKEDDEDAAAEESQPERNRNHHSRWQSVPNPFKRKRASPPAEVQKARDVTDPGLIRVRTPAHNFSRWDVKNRLGVLAAEAGERFRERNGGRSQDAEVPVTVIPAQPRGSHRTWSPEVLHQQQESVATRNDRSSRALQFSEPQNSETHNPADLSHSTTLTANSIPAAEAASRDSNTPRANDLSAGGTSDSPTVVPSPRRIAPTSRGSFSRQHDPPPRADDISPSAGSTGTVVIPAPRRSPLRAVTTTPPTRDSLHSSGTPGVEPNVGDNTPQRHSPLRNSTTSPTAGSAPQ
ncbi:hypothetical protein Q7P37_001998 [Cladosporium fusiforme]